MVLPGFWGGVETPAAVADGVVYVATANLPSLYDSTAFGAKDGDEAVANMEGRIEYSSGTGEVVALDINTGKILWDTPLPAIDFGGATVVNDLVFTATYDGVIYALSRADGSIVWSFQAPGGIIAWPAVASDSIVWPIGLGRVPQVLTLRLGAKGGTGQPAARNVTTPTPAGTPFTVPSLTGIVTSTVASTVTPTATITATTTVTGTPRSGRSANADPNGDVDGNADDHRHAGGYGHADDHADADDYRYTSIRAVGDGDAGHQHDADDYGDDHSDTNCGADDDADTDPHAGAYDQYFGHHGDYRHAQHQRHAHDYRHAEHYGDGNDHRHADAGAATAAHEHIGNHGHPGVDAGIDAGRADGQSGRSR